QTLRPGHGGGEPFSLPAARAPGTLASSTGAPAHGGREGTGMRIQGEDLARVVVAGLAAAFLAGLLTALWTAPEPLPRATLIGAVVVIGLITAAGYRHAGALAAAGAVLTLLGAAQLYSVSITPLAMREEARSGGGPVDEMLQGPAHSLLLGCLLLGAACGWGMVAVAVVAGGVAIWPMSGATGLDAYDEGTLQLLRVVVTMVVGVVVGALPTLSPVAAVPTAVGLGIAVSRVEEPGAAATGLMVVLVMVLATAVHFLAPVEPADPADERAHGWSWDMLAPGRRS